MGALKENPLLQPLSKPMPWWTWPRIGVAMATAVLLVIVGYQIGIRQTPSSPTASPTSMTFALFLYMDQVAEPRVYPENTLKVYQEWGTNLQEKGVDLSGDLLMENGAILFIKDKKIEMMSFEDWDLVMQGYYIFKAESYDETLEIASSNPHLKFGGSVVLREIDRP